MTALERFGNSPNFVNFDKQYGEMSNKKIAFILEGNDHHLRDLLNDSPFRDLVTPRVAALTILLLSRREIQRSPEMMKWAVENINAHRHMEVVVDDKGKSNLRLQENFGNQEWKKQLESSKEIVTVNYKNQKAEINTISVEKVEEISSDEMENISQLVNALAAEILATQKEDKTSKKREREERFGSPVDAPVAKKISHHSAKVKDVEKPIKRDEHHRRSAEESQKLAAKEDIKREEKDKQRMEKAKEVNRKAEEKDFERHEDDQERVKRKAVEDR